MTHRVFTVVICLLALAACKRRTSIEDLKNYLRDADNGLIQSKKANGLDMTVVYRPSDVWVSNDLPGALAQSGIVDSLRQKYDKYYFFLLSLSRDNEEALQVSEAYDYGEVMRTMAFRMPEFVMLTSSAKDTLHIVDFMLDRTNGMARSTDILFAFQKSELRGNDKVSFSIAEFGLGAGDQTFDFEMRDILSVPKVDFETK